METLAKVDWGKHAPGVPSWLRPASVGCAVLVFILFVLLVGGMFSTLKVRDWGLNRLGSSVLAKLSPETPPPLRSHLTKSLYCALQAARDGRLDEQTTGALSRACLDALADKHVSVEEATRLDTLATQQCIASGSVVPP
jgi:hypothetical protein